MVQSCLENIEKCSHRDNEKSSNLEESSKKPTYDPHKYGNTHHPTIFWGPVLHLLKTIIGTGVLALPYIFKSVGYTVAISGTIIIGYLYTHVLHLMLEVEYELCKILRVPNLTYVGVVEHSFQQGPRIFRRCTKPAKFLSYFHYVVNKAMSNAVYLITIGGNFKIILNHYFDTDITTSFIMSVAMIPLISLSMIRNLKFLVPLSMLCNIFSLINIILILTIPSNYDGSVDLRAINDITTFPNFFGIVLGALHGTGIVLPLKNDMKNPKRFTTLFGVLNIALAAVTVLYCIFGFLGYSKYGDQLQPNILFNLPPNHILSLVVLTLYSSAICISYTLFVYIGFDTIWVNLFKGEKVAFPLATEYSIRLSICILPYIMAIVLPSFKLMITLNGVIGIFMDQLLPLIFHVLLLATNKQWNWKTYLIFFKDLFLIVISLFLFIAALLNVIRNIIDFYKKI